jgi:hypothetical protein
LRKICNFEGFAARYGRLPRASEIGCAAAHRFCYETLVAEHGDLGLVLEDDAVIRGSLDDLLNIIEEGKIDFSLLSLKITNGVYRRKASVIGSQGAVYRSTFAQFGAHAYIVRRDLAEKMAMYQRPKIGFLADWPLYGPMQLGCFKVYGVDTRLVALSGRPSTIDSMPLADKIATLNYIYKLRQVLNKLYLRVRFRIFGDRTAGLDDRGDIRWYS